MIPSTVIPFTSIGIMIDDSSGLDEFCCLNFLTLTVDISSSLELALTEEKNIFFEPLSLACHRYSGD